MNYRLIFIFMILINQFWRISSVKKLANNRKRQENLCPTEYESCWCEYTNPNNQDITSDQQDSKVSLSSSIMINCQYYFSNENSDKKLKLNKTLQILNKIPKITTSNSGFKKKILNSITHLDLSRTNIAEIPTDAFQGLYGLQTIVVEYCKNLSVIQMFAFRNLPNLKTLIISNNPNLAELEPHSFGGLKNLNFLSLVNNKLTNIDGYIFSTSSSIKIIDFIGNPIKRIKSHAFDGLRNVSDLLLSMEQKVTPIETIEGDAFISTAFVDQIFLEGIPARVLSTNAFRGLSFCKNLHLSNSFIEEIESNAFLRTNNVNKINLKNSRLKYINKDAFRGVFNIKEVDLRGNYLTRVNQSTFEQILLSNGMVRKDKSLVVNESIKIIDFEPSNNFIIEKILFEQNPIQCDCNLLWVLNDKSYQEHIAMPEICAGPKGYDCLRVQDLKVEDLRCNESVPQSKLPCEDLFFDIDKNMDTFLLSESKNTHVDIQTTETKIENRIDLSDLKQDNIESDEDEEDIEEDFELLKINEIRTTKKLQDKLILTTNVVSLTSKKSLIEDLIMSKDLINQSLGLSNSANRFYNFVWIFSLFYFLFLFLSELNFCL